MFLKPCEIDTNERDRTITGGMQRDHERSCDPTATLDGYVPPHASQIWQPHEIGLQTPKTSSLKGRCFETSGSGKHRTSPDQHGSQPPANQQLLSVNISERLRALLWQMLWNKSVGRETQPFRCTLHGSQQVGVRVLQYNLNASTLGPTLQRHLGRKQLCSYID